MSSTGSAWCFFSPITAPVIIAMTVSLSKKHFFRVIPEMHVVGPDFRAARAGFSPSLPVIFRNGTGPTMLSFTWCVCTSKYKLILRPLFLEGHQVQIASASLTLNVSPKYLVHGEKRRGHTAGRLQERTP